jgi:peptidoglycan hydrolase-like protein with peptidoglycan-binding domain
VNRRVAAASVTFLLLLSACGDDGSDDDPVGAAQQRLDDATAELDAASSQFCDDAASYIESVDRYGGLITDGEATVGAVNDAGADLEEPREAVEGSAEAVGDARDEVAAAQQELADAQAEAGVAATDETTETTMAPVPDAIVSRVEQAESDLADAFGDIDESTPLSEATTQVNAAAVSLQVAWAQLFASAGCLEDDQRQQLVTAMGAYTSALQGALAAAGYFDGEIDGVYGPATVDAVERLQEDAGLPVTGFVDQATSQALDDAIDAAGGDAAATEVAHTAALQAVLTITGHWTGPIDGEWSDALTGALSEFQTDLGVPPTGVVDPPTVAAAQQALEDLRNPETTTTTEPDDGGDEGGGDTATSTTSG